MKNDYSLKKKIVSKGSNEVTLIELTQTTKERSLKRLSVFLGRLNAWFADESPPKLG